MDNRPKSREKHVTNDSKGVHKRGSGTGQGPVGKGGRPGAGGSGNPSGGGKRASGGYSSGGSSGGGGLFKIIIALVVLLVGGGGGALSMLGGGGSSTGSSSGSNSYQSLYSSQSSSSSWSSNNNLAKLDTSVAEGSRDKYTTINGDGSDQTTIMVYMCGTDLESKSGMATNDLKEMASATFGTNINLIVYTGGCTAWKISGISSKVNQIYQVKNGNLYVLEKDMGNKCMTTPSTLTEFINYCKKKFPANRNDLILWDHGGGSVSGYGYDEKNANKGSMSLSGIKQALTDSKMKFDFIGFDACLMATVENAQMLGDFADYLIASEETEPGIGWYYTDWLTAYGEDPSMDTLTLGKNIIDTFISACNKSVAGQQTTLSIIDLAEFANTVQDKLSDFSTDTVQMIKDDNYQTVANARASAREFAQSSKIDQVDLVDLAYKMDTKASKALAKTLLSAIKYNRTSSNMTNAYGVSIYFPNKRLSNVDTAVSINKSIGMDDDYSKCIQEYASLEVSGQTVSTGVGNTGSPLSSLMGTLLTGGLSSSGSSSVTSGTADSDLTSQLLQALLTSGVSNLGSLSGGSTNFLSGKSLTTDETVDYITDHQFDSSNLEWKESGDQEIISLSEDQWSMVTDLEMNMFYDDGEGYVDLGLDNVFDFDDDGNLVGSTDKTWLAIDGQPVAYYHTSTVEDGDDYTITGYVPAMLNDTRVNLLLTFDQDNPDGYISGIQTDYTEGETETVAKAEGELQAGDTLEFLCDYYTYDGDYQDTYYLGDPMTVTDDMTISNVSVGEGDVSITYKFTDIYGMDYWTPVMP